MKEDAGETVGDDAVKCDVAEIKAHLICRCYGHKVGGAAFKIEKSIQPLK